MRPAPPLTGPRTGAARVRPRALAMRPGPSGCGPGLREAAPGSGPHPGFCL
ncbi:unnamed protein product [[Actinomadura] parvosata subsp. kistnae]|nr:unnamed protein product [Actinomadura parvosata subsp. kistnae]